jgi:nucleoside-diphosphate-sugar epimerase
VPEFTPIQTQEELIQQMTTPTPAVEAAVKQLDGDILILGVAGKMGPTLAELMVRAGARRVIGVSRFSDAPQRSYLEQCGVETVRADLLDEAELAALPDAPNVFLLAGFKFGATGNEAMTWAMNTWLPGKVMQRYPESRVVYVSSGNVYAYTPVGSRGAPEGGDVGPVGEYAQSRLGGERVAEFFCQRQGTPLAIVRLFYATEPRYGIIHDLAWRIYHDEPIDLSMGHVNQIWQGDANGYLARSLPLCASPARVINLTGPDVLRVRHLASSLGQALGREPVFVGTEAENALLGDASALVEQLGPPPTSIERIVEWVAHWVQHGGHSLGKPTKYESRSGKF